MPDPLEQAKQSLLQKSMEEHKSRADRLHALSLAASFGSLYYLISLEELLPPKDSLHPWAIQISWWLAYLSAILGSLHLWMQMFVPLQTVQIANESAKIVHQIGLPALKEWTRRKAARLNLWGLPLFGHIVCLFALFLLSGFYRMANFPE